MNTKGQILLPIITLLCLAGFIGSYLFPNEVLDTYAVNATEEEGDTQQIHWLLSADDEVEYRMKTDGRTMKGIQIGISLPEAVPANTNLSYRLYKEGALLYEGAYDLSTCLDGQYPYLPFEGADASGELRIVFSCSAASESGTQVGIFCNHKTDPDGETVIAGEPSDLALKVYYIYSHDTYPFLYDARVLTFLFFAASCVADLSFLKKKKEEREPGEEDKREKKHLSPDPKAIVRWALIVLCTGLLAVCLDVIFFNLHSLSGTYETELTAETFSMEDSYVYLSDQEMYELEVAQENERIMAEYEGRTYEEVLPEGYEKRDGKIAKKCKAYELTYELPEARYIRKLAFYAPVTDAAGISVDLFSDGEKVADGMYCSVSPALGAGVMNVGKSGDRVTIGFLASDEIKEEDIRLAVSNKLRIEPVRVLFFFTCLFCLCLLFVRRDKEGARKPEWIFAISAFLCGGILILGIGTNQVGFDEYVHAKAAYALSFGSTIETTEAAMEMGGNLLPYYNNPEERDLVYAYLDEMNDPNVIAPNISHQSRLPRTETRVYYPMAAGFYVGRMLHLSFADMVALAKFGNLICYIAIVCFAIKLAEAYPLVVMAIGLLPNNIFIASELSYDALVTSCLLLGYVLLLNEFLQPNRRLRPWRLAAMLFVFEVGCLSKPVYIFMACMLVFLPKHKFKNRLSEVLCKLAVVAFAGMMLYNIFRPTPVSGGDYQLVSNVIYSGDKRSVGTSTMGQIEYIMHNAVAYASLLLKEMFSMLGDYVLPYSKTLGVGGIGYVNYAYLGAAPFLVNYLMIAVGICTALTSDIRKRTKEAVGLAGLTKAQKALTHLMNFGVAAVVFTSMYVSYNAVGADTILGVQGRYFIPLFLPFLSTLFGCRQIGNEKVRQYIERGCVIVMIGLNLYMTWSMVVTAMNV
ncbi:MAG: DUF2142 domain-containing protein [Lachnospiraceae bacterium]|nr:DUF2142 domain-containing protein [Lachnospiraceae bacterium]